MSYRDGIIMDEILAHIKSEEEGLKAAIEEMLHDTMTECTREYLRGIISQRRIGIATLKRIMNALECNQCNNQQGARYEKPRFQDV